MEIIVPKSVEKFIQSLTSHSIAKTIHAIELLERFTYQLTMPHSKKITNNLLELRTSGKQKVRIFYTFHKSKIILLHGFIKKSQRTPQKEIKTALNILNKLT